MSRMLVLAGTSLALLGSAASAQTRPVPNYAFGKIPTNPHEDVGNRIWELSDPGAAPDQADTYAVQVDQIVRWGKVGRCVVGADPDGSAAFAKTTYPSHAARAAANKLVPAFDACFAGAGVVGKSNIPLRHAAVIDALNAVSPKP